MKQFVRGIVGASHGVNQNRALPIGALDSQSTRLSDTVQVPCVFAFATGFAAFLKDERTRPGCICPALRQRVTSNLLPFRRGECCKTTCHIRYLSSFPAAFFLRAAAAALDALIAIARRSSAVSFSILALAPILPSMLRALDVSCALRLCCVFRFVAFVFIHSNPLPLAATFYG